MSERLTRDHNRRAAAALHCAFYVRIIGDVRRLAAAIAIEEVEARRLHSRHRRSLGNNRHIGGARDLANFLVPIEVLRTLVALAAVNANSRNAALLEHRNELQRVGKLKART